MSSPTDLERQMKRAIRIKINDTVEKHCKGCTVYTANYKEYGQTAAQSKCTAECEVGKELSALGQLLLAGKEPKDENEKEELLPLNKVVTKGMGEQLIREKYLELSGTLTDRRIAEQYNMTPQTLIQKKKKWGITVGKRNAALPQVEKGELPKLTTQESDRFKEQLAQKDAEIIKLKKEIKKLSEEAAIYLEHQQEPSDGPTFHEVLARLGHISIRTEDEQMADLIKQGLFALGSDLDYKVRSGIIEVTTVPSE
ncbi:zinc-finger domain-containing protein [Brevibacillus reuszeri]|uniref:zinc-finger domain-containing protein n=1 Tax=Brevibacillus reuszeri TaxID=54915 RepID=UPI00366AF77A